MVRSEHELPGFAPGERLDALSIAALFNQVNLAIARTFPRGPGIWVRGEIQGIEQHRSGHCYIDLVDPDSAPGRDRPVLKVNCWRTAWGPIKAVLAGQGVSLEAGMVVTLRGRVELYAPRSQVSFIAAEIDVASLVGRLAAQRAALLKALDTEGLLGRNRALAVPPLPLRVGLVASPGTEGYADFLGQLQSAGFGFTVLHVPVQVQGQRAAPAMARALQHLAGQSCDLVVLVRGGGAKADLVAFDSEPLARAITAHPHPVWTGIGHSGDQSVADIVAQRAFITPTECGQEIVRSVRSWWGEVDRRARLVIRSATAVAAQAHESDTHARHRLVRGARSQLTGHAGQVRTAGIRIASHAHRQIDTASASVQAWALRMGPMAGAVVDRHTERIAQWRRLIDAYDVDRQLERGYTLTMDEDGGLVRSAAAVEPGRNITTRFADGLVTSTVEKRAARSRPGEEKS